MQHVNQLEPSRRTLLRAGAVAGTAAGLGAAGILRAPAASAAAAVGHGRTHNPPYPPAVTDVSHCTPEVAALFRRVFTAKSEHDTAAFMSFFSATDARYIDACLGVAITGWPAINATFASIFAGKPADAVSYPLTILGDSRSAAVEFVDSPAFFSQEIRALSSVTFDGKHKITRWVDYWDGRSSLIPNTVADSYPTGFGDSGQNADRAVIQAADRLQAAFAAGDAAAAVALMSVDVVHEDMAAHTRVRGRFQAQRYYTRALGQLPYGPGAAVLHVDGSRHGGGYEWSAAPTAAPMRRGHTGIELDETGKISRLTVVYDSSLLSDAAYRSLVGLAAE